jgi:hypothetical protein
VDGATGPDASNAGSLDEAPPVFRDPRLDDPDDLAMEAAAIAVAAALIQKPQIQFLAPAVPSDAQTEAGIGGDCGGGAAAFSQALVQEELGLTLGTPGIPLEFGLAQAPAQGTVDPGAKAGVVTAPGLEMDASERASMLGQQAVPGRQAAPEVVLTAQSAAIPQVSERAITVVVTATPVELSALAQAGALATESVSLAQPVVLGSEQTAPKKVSTSGLIVEGSGSEGFSPMDASGDDLLNLVGTPAQFASEASSDSEFLSSPIPSNPAAAFFAAKATSDSDNTSQTGPALNAAPLKASGVDEEIAPESAAGALASTLVPNKDDSEARAEHLGNRSAQTKGSEPQSAALSGSQRGSSVIAENDLGTDGALEGGVRRDATTEPEQTLGRSASARFSMQEFSVQDGSRSEAAGYVVPQDSTAARASQLVSSKPQVLPPVHIKSGELFGVIQNALERARSQNPSHLAVEVTLEDGSVFGLEVRMSASGLQASFRSESQALLKALEGNWSAFVAKETAESKTVSATFEGRSGFGEFSNNESNAGDKRQRFEDNASAASLMNPGGDGKQPASTPGETASVSASVPDGLALYA